MTHPIQSSPVTPFPSHTKGETGGYSLVEFIFPFDSFILNPSYFSPDRLPLVQGLEIEVGEDLVTVYGIIKNGPATEGEPLVDLLFEPVIESKKLKEVVDEFITQEIETNLIGFIPPTVTKVPSNVLRTYFKFSMEEQEQLIQELDRTESLGYPPGEVREALGRFCSARLQTAYIDQIRSEQVVIDMGVIHAEFKIKQLKKQFLSFIRPRLMPKELKEAIEALPEISRKFFSSSLRFLEKREDLFQRLPAHFTPLELTEIVLGEELYKRIFRKMGIQWKLPKKNVPKLHELLASHIENIRHLYRESPDIREEEIARVHARFDPFQLVEDHYLDERKLSWFLPLLKKQPEELPKLEKVQRALRTYFRFEKMEKEVTTKLLNIFNQLESKVDPQKKVKLAEELRSLFLVEEKMDWVEKLSISSRLSSTEEKLLFFDLFHDFFPLEMDLLLSSPSDGLNEQKKELNFDHIERHTERALRDLEILCKEMRIWIEFDRMGSRIRIP